jgi:hypothetical protein
MTKKQRFEQLIRAHLLPLFPQARLREIAPSKAIKKASFIQEKADLAIRLQLNRDADHSFEISRKQSFQAIEKQTMEMFVEVTERVLPYMEEDFGETLLKSQMDVVVAKTVAQSAGRPEAWKLLVGVFSAYQTWSQETYEGHRVASAIGLSDSTGSQLGGILMEDYLALNMAKVIGDGFSSLCIVNASGRLEGHDCLPSADEKDNTFAPFAFIPLAKWATGRNIGVALNRGGEILVFSGGELTFARRRGNWLPFCHKAAVAQLSLNNRFLPEVRLASYLTSLDISFARLGGGIGLVKKGETIIGGNLPVQPRDALSGDVSPKIKSFNVILKGRKFQDIGRPLRKEIGGVDGAVVLDHTGSILTAGAVLAVSISSDEGARRTAARTLGRHGIGIKISSDGKIEAYSGQTTAQQEALFEVG